jgi:transposase
MQIKQFSGKPIFSQLLNFISKDKVNRTAEKHKADAYTKKLTTYDHLITMLYAVFSNCISLRDLSTALLACDGKINHFNMSHFPKRSTLSDANNRRTPELFADIYYDLLKEYQPVLSDSRKNLAVQNLYIVDSTTISLFDDILKGVGRNPLEGKKKGGLKVHTLINASQDIPTLVKMTASATHDHTFLKEIKLPMYSWIVFDKGYNDYNYYAELSRKEIYFVTRQKENAQFECIEEYGISDDSPSNLLKEEHIHIKGNVCLRRIAWYDEEKQRCFEFITNNFELPAEKIAGIYRNRWQIELLFKRLKQNFSLKYFLGNSENAIKIQIWITLIAALILQIIHKIGAKKWAFSNVASLIKYHLHSYIKLFEFLKNPQASFHIITTKIIDKPPELMRLF